MRRMFAEGVRKLCHVLECDMSATLLRDARVVHDLRSTGNLYGNQETNSNVCSIPLKSLIKQVLKFV